MIELLVKRNFLERNTHEEDRRRFQLKLSVQGQKTYKKLIPIIRSNREQALCNFDESEIQLLSTLLQKITTNCTKELSIK